jgi:hypothetical protein
MPTGRLRASPGGWRKERLLTYVPRLTAATAHVSPSDAHKP